MVECTLTINEWYKFVGMAGCKLFLYSIIEKCLIVYLPCMSLEDMVDCTFTIYERYDFVGHGWSVYLSYTIMEIFDCILPVYVLGIHGRYEFVGHD